MLCRRWWRVPDKAAEDTEVAGRVLLDRGQAGLRFQTQKGHRNTFGIGSMYKPRGRNYFLVNATLTPERAALLLVHGFFSRYPENRRRLASKALDSACISRYVLLFSAFDSKPFSREDLKRERLEVKPDFIGRSVLRGFLKPFGVVKTRGNEYHWCRSYTLSSGAQILARRVLEATGGAVADGHATTV